MAIDVQSLIISLVRRLPQSWQPYVYPPLQVKPDEPISEHLVDAVRACAGFVYVHSPASLSSFWVGFERNTAARLGKPVYAFRPGWPLFAFRRDRSAAADSIVSVLFNMAVREDVETLSQIRDLVWDRFHFEIRGDQWSRLDNDPRQMIDTEDGRTRKLAVGGVVLLLCTPAHERPARRSERHDRTRAPAAGR